MKNKFFKHKNSGLEIGNFFKIQINLHREFS